VPESLTPRNLTPALSSIGADTDTVRALAAIERQRQALELLRRSHQELSKKVTALQERSERTLMTLLQELAGVNEGLRVVQVQAQTIRAQRLSAQRLAIRQQRQLRALATTSRLQQVTAVVNSVQGSAFGAKGSILATNNLLLAANQLLWIFLDPVLRSVGIIEGTSPSLAVWLAPLGSLVTGQLVLGNRQHVRFISGVTRFDTQSVVFESLRDRIADDLWPEFQRRTDVPVTVAPLDRIPGRDPIASVENGVLRIEIPIGILHAGVTIRVAWMVDTGADGG
jgi:hypothetical protein